MPRKPRNQARAIARDTRQEAGLGQPIQHGEGGGGGDRIAAEGASVIAGGQDARVSLRHEGGAEGQPAAERLG